MADFLNFAATNKFLLGTANVVAFLTATFFFWKGARATASFGISIYKSSVKAAINQRRIIMRQRAIDCASDPSFFIAYLARRTVIVVAATVSAFVVVSTQERTGAVTASILLCIIVVFGSLFRIQFVAFDVMARLKSDNRSKD